MPACEPFKEAPDRSKHDGDFTTGSIAGPAFDSARIAVSSARAALPDVIALPGSISAPDAGGIEQTPGYACSALDVHAGSVPAAATTFPISASSRTSDLLHDLTVTRVVLFALMLTLLGWVAWSIGVVTASGNVSPSGLVDAMLLRPVRVPVSASPSVIVYGTPAEQATADAAVERYTSLGLLLPDLSIHFIAPTKPSAPSATKLVSVAEDAPGTHEYDNEGSYCSTMVGWFEVHRGVWQVFVCRDTLLDPSRVLMHELSHAWSYAALTDDERDHALNVFGLEQWDGGDTPYDERGTEYLAYLMEKVMFEDFWNRDGSFRGPDTALQTYSLITGVSPDDLFATFTFDGSPVDNTGHYWWPYLPAK